MFFFFFFLCCFLFFFFLFFYSFFFFFFQAEDGIRDFCLSRGLGDVYKRQKLYRPTITRKKGEGSATISNFEIKMVEVQVADYDKYDGVCGDGQHRTIALMFDELKDVTATYQSVKLSKENMDILAYISVSYTHLRAHETGRNLVCRLLLEKKKKKSKKKKKKKTQNKKKTNKKDQEARNENTTIKALSSYG